MKTGRSPLTARASRSIRWWRARTQERKEERRNAILSSAWDLFRQADYSAITVAQVARGADLAKGTVYLYFETKEELFLEVAFSKLDEWLNALDRGLDARSGPRGSVDVTALLCKTLKPRRDLLRLLSLLPTMFETNVDHATVARFKQAILGRIVTTGARMEHSLPFLRPGEGARLLLLIQAFVIGLWKMTDPAPVAARALEDPTLRAMRIEFFSEFGETVAALLSGFEVRAKRRRWLTKRDAERAHK